MSSEELERRLFINLFTGNIDEVFFLLSELHAAQLRQAKDAYAQTGACTHRHRQGDNYGISCLICHERLAGFGYLASHKDCLHVWRLLEDDQQYCIYCVATRPKTKTC